jgi:hypothetical protein
LLALMRSAADVAVFLLVQLRQTEDGPFIVVDLTRLRSRRFGHQPNRRSVVAAVDYDNCECVKPLFAVSGTSGNFAQFLHDRDSLPRLIVFRDDRFSCRQIEIISSRADELGGHVDHCEPCGDGVR